MEKNKNIEELKMLYESDADPELKMKLIKDLAKPYNRMIAYYECAIAEVETKLNNLNRDYKLDNEFNPINSIRSRIKSVDSIVEKAHRRNFALTIESLEENMKDIAGVRVVCNFPEDVYKVREGLLLQDDIELIEEKDYIKNPKENGYRSLHLIIKTPIFLSTGKKMMYVEVQIRTIAENFWASLEHQLRYKKNIEEKEAISKELKELAEESAKLDLRMEELKKKMK